GKNGSRQLEFTLMNVVLDDALRSALEYTPSGKNKVDRQRLWDLISPTGKMNGEYVFSRIDGKKSFGLKFKGVHGKVTYEKFPLQVKIHSGEAQWANQKFVLKDVHASHEKSPIKISGSFSPKKPVEGDRVSITAERLSLGQELKAALLPNIQKFWEQLSPRGTTNASADLLGVKDGGWRYKMALDSEQMQIAYEKFPCATKVKACNVEWDKTKLSFTNGKLEAFGADVLFSGDISLMPDGSSRLRFEFNEMSLESGFQKYLPTEANKFLNQFNLKGKVDGDLEISYGKNTPATFSLQVRGKGATVAYRALPMPVQLESAHLTWGHTGFELKQLIGKTGEGIVNVAAMVPLTAGEHAQVDLKATDVTLSETLRNALPSGARTAWDNFQPKGRADLDAKIEWKSGQQAKSLYSVTVGCKDISAKFKHFPAPMSGLNGKLTFTPGRLAMPKLTGMTRKSLLTIEGTVEWAGNSVNPNLIIHAEDIPLDNHFFELLPADYQTVWKELNTAGTVHSIDYSLKTDAEKKTQHTFTASLKDGSLTYQRFPLPLSDLTGTFKWENGEMKVDDLEGKSFGKPIKANARFSDGAMNVELDASGQSFGKKLYDALPATVQAFYKDVSPTGDLDFSVKVESKWDAVSSQAKFATEIELKNVVASTGTDLKDMFGVLRLKGAVYGEELVSMDGTAELKSVKIRDQNFTDVTATIAQEEGRVFIKELRAGYHGGLVRARIDQDRKENVTALDLSFSKVDISHFGKGFGSDSKVSGALRGEIALTMKGSDIQSMKGKGKVSMDGGELFALPTLDAITGILKGSKTNKIREMHMNFDLAGPNLDVHLMKLIGNNYNVYGFGKISFDWHLDLHLFVAKRSLVTRVANTLGSLPFFKVIPALVEPLQASMLQLELKGPADKAAPKSTPFEHSLPKELWEEIRKDGKNT
ncbi:MAG: AsmA-like C-terminal region-containing protein, partial [Planctomycetota bacterium]|nr:AsmA-like C-terminal region-containing protein [Planctomycetota bacterium]